MRGVWVTQHLTPEGDRLEVIRTKNCNASCAFKIAIRGGNMMDSEFSHPGEDHGIVRLGSRALSLNLYTSNDLLVSRIEEHIKRQNPLSILPVVGKRRNESKVTTQFACLR